MFGAVERKGMTLVPLSVYFNSTGRAKVELALAKGKQAHDKREAVKDRDWKRDKARLMREKGERPRSKTFMADLIRKYMPSREEMAEKVTLADADRASSS